MHNSDVSWYMLQRAAKKNCGPIKEQPVTEGKPWWGGFARGTLALTQLSAYSCDSEELL